jgi:hypothetical protein
MAAQHRRHFSGESMAGNRALKLRRRALVKARARFLHDEPR